LEYILQIWGELKDGVVDPIDSLNILGFRSYVMINYLPTRLAAGAWSASHRAGKSAWAHDFNPDRAIGATFQTLPARALSTAPHRRRNHAL
jgi:hypothetical protein